MNKNELETLKHLTNQLIDLNMQAVNKYQNEQYTPDFYNDIKPFSDQIYETASQWKSLTLQWLKHETKPYLYPHQIENTYENLLSVSVQAFQKKSRSKRFQATIKSNDYILQTMKKYLQT